MGIDVRHISKTFGSFQALDEVTLTVPDGELVALLGPSGSGKTTLLRIIAGLEAPDPAPDFPDAGITFDGQDVSTRRIADRRVGFVFQHYALFRHMTVFENIAFGLRVKPRGQRLSRQELCDRVRELLHLVSLEAMDDRLPAQLSGGQRQRVALARALAIQPRVLLLDEPFGALDPKVRQGLRRWLRRLHDEIHVTSVFVTHDQEEALEVADQVVLMNRGKVEQVGTPDEVFHHPASAFVMEFLGQVNLFHGRIEQGKAVFGGLVVDHASAPGAEGQTARLAVRPHDLDIATQPDGEHVLRAKVERIQSAGPVVKLELTGADGQTFHAELPHDRFHELQVRTGQDVFVGLKEARVFVEDYAI